MNTVTPSTQWIKKKNIFTPTATFLLKVSGQPTHMCSTSVRIPKRSVAFRLGRRARAQSGVVVVVLLGVATVCYLSTVPKAHSTPSR